MTENSDLTDASTFDLAELSIGFLAPPAVFDELHRRVQQMLETDFENVVWEMRLSQNLTDDPDHRENYAGLYEQVEIESTHGLLGKRTLRQAQGPGRGSGTQLFWVAEPVEASPTRHPQSRRRKNLARAAASAGV
jgi:hypothetical protein